MIRKWHAQAAQLASRCSSFIAKRCRMPCCLSMFSVQDTCKLVRTTLSFPSRSVMACAQADEPGVIGVNHLLQQNLQSILPVWRW